VRAAAEKIGSRFGPEYCIKPVRAGGSAGFHHVRPGTSLADALREAFTSIGDDESLLVEEFIRGREATVGLLSAYRNEPDYAFPTIEVGTPVESPYHSAAAKAADSIPISAPGRFSLREREQLMHVARTAHHQLGLDQYSRTDCIVRDGEVYFLEINPLPQLHEHGLYAEAAAAAGCRYEDLIEHLVQTATRG
jgi:D-alanine-D-alanine ligase